MRAGTCFCNDFLDNLRVMASELEIPKPAPRPTSPRREHAGEQKAGNRNGHLYMVGDVDLVQSANVS